MIWQPIETAPRDGREIIAFLPDTGAPSDYGAGDEDFLRLFFPSVRSVVWKEDWYGDVNNPGWMPANLDEEYGEFVFPSHWLPMPDAPTGGA